MKKLRIIVSLLLCSTIIFAFTACGNQEPKIEYEEKYDEVMEVEDNLNKLAFPYVLPDKPAEKPVSDPLKVSTLKTPVSQGGGYNIAQNTDGSYTISYTNIDNWQYVYLPVDNYLSDYSNFYITSTANDVSQVTVAAVYYEQYEKNYPAVAIGSKKPTSSEYLVDQNILFNFDDKYIVDDSYTVKSGDENKLTKQTIIGFILFIESMPSQFSSYRSGTYKMDAKLLKNDDPLVTDFELDPPLVGNYDPAPAYNVEKDPETGAVTITYKPSELQKFVAINLEVMGYTSEYKKVEYSIHTETYNMVDGQKELVPGGIMYFNWELTYAPFAGGPTESWFCVYDTIMGRQGKETQPSGAGGITPNNVGKEAQIKVIDFTNAKALNGDWSASNVPISDCGITGMILMIDSGVDWSKPAEADGNPPRFTCDYEYATIVIDYIKFIK